MTPLTAEEIAALCRLVPPVARGEWVTLRRMDYERVRELLPRLLNEVEQARAALREQDAAWAKAVNDALGICIWPYHEVCDRCAPLRALLEEAGK